MSGLPPLHSPRYVYRDLRAFFSRRSREQGIALALSLAITGFIVFLFWLDPKVNTAPPTTITFVNSWPSDRSDAEIKEAQAKYMAEKKARERARQQEFQEIANTFGIE